MDSVTRRISSPLTSLRRHARLLSGAMLLAGFIAYAAFLITHMGAYAGGSDSSGYMNSAKLLAEGKCMADRRTIDSSASTAPLSASGDYTFSPLGFSPRSESTLVPTYPIGMPLMIALTAQITGWHAAPGVVVAGHALAALLLFYALGRSWEIPRGWVVFGVIILAGCPLLIMFSIQSMSDVPALTWTLASVLLAWHGRTKLIYALAAGAAVGMAVLTRPTNILLMAPLLVILGMRWKQWLLLGAGGAPFALLFLGYNYLAYGHALETGYGSISAMISPTWLAASLENYARWLPALLSPAFLLGAGVFLVRGKAIEIRLALVSWASVFFGFYAFYSCTHETWWYLRFTLPAFPALLLAAIATGSHLAQKTRLRLFDVEARPPALAVSTALILGVIFNSCYWTEKLGALSSRFHERQYYEASKLAAARLPPDAVVASLQLSGALFYYTDFTIVRWDTLSEKGKSLLNEAIERSGRPFYLVEMEGEIERALRDYIPGHWTEMSRTGNVRILRRDAMASTSTSLP